MLIYHVDYKTDIVKFIPIFLRYNQVCVQEEYFIRTLDWCASIDFYYLIYKYV